MLPAVSSPGSKAFRSSFLWPNEKKQEAAAQHRRASHNQEDMMGNPVLLKQPCGSIQMDRKLRPVHLPALPLSNYCSTWATGCSGRPNGKLGLAPTLQVIVWRRLLLQIWRNTDCQVECHNQLWRRSRGKLQTRWREEFHVIWIGPHQFKHRKWDSLMEDTSFNYAFCEVVCIHI